MLGTLTASDHVFVNSNSNLSVFLSRAPTLGRMKIKGEGVVPDRFFVVLFTVLGLTLASGVTACAMALICPDPARPMQTELFKACVAIFQTGVGAIIGLLGGHGL